MSHLSGFCECGRRIHYDWYATHGSQWTCYRCGRSYTISTRGDPLHRIGSHRRGPGRSETGSGSGDSTIESLLQHPWVVNLIIGLIVAGLILIFFGKIVFWLLVIGWVWFKWFQ